MERRAAEPGAGHHRGSRDDAVRPMAEAEEVRCGQRAIGGRG